MSTALPNPSGFRSITLPPGAPVRLFVACLVNNHIDFNYSFDGEHHFVYPVKHYAKMVHLMHEVFSERQNGQAPNSTTNRKAEMAGTLHNTH